MAWLLLLDGESIDLSHWISLCDATVYVVLTDDETALALFRETHPDCIPVLHPKTGRVRGFRVPSPPTPPEVLELQRTVAEQVAKGGSGAMQDGA